MVRHTFYIEHEDGTVLEWTGLSHRRAQTMLGYTQVCKPEGSCRWGWYEEAHPVMGDEFKNLTNVREGTRYEKSSHMMSCPSYKSGDEDDCLCKPS